jgi:hypothetical protein
VRRTWLLWFAITLLVLVSVVSMVAANESRDPAALIPGGLGLSLLLPISMAQRGRHGALARLALGCVAVLLMLAGLLTQGRAMLAEPLLTASSLPLFAALVGLWGALPEPLGGGWRRRVRLVVAALGLVAAVALLSWYPTVGIHFVLPVVLPALTVWVGTVLLAASWLRLPDPPGAD